MGFIFDSTTKPTMANAIRGKSCYDPDSLQMQGSGPDVHVCTPTTIQEIKDKIMEGAAAMPVMVQRQPMI
jgi:hypothetical protein